MVTYQEITWLLNKVLPPLPGTLLKHSFLTTLNYTSGQLQVAVTIVLFKPNSRTQMSTLTTI